MGCCYRIQRAHFRSQRNLGRVPRKEKEKVHDTIAGAVYRAHERNAGEGGLRTFLHPVMKRTCVLTA